MHNISFPLCLWAGIADTKPSVISLLEQGKEPWMVMRNETKEWHPGECWSWTWGAWQVVTQAACEKAAL